MTYEVDYVSRRASQSPVTKGQPLTDCEHTGSLTLIKLAELLLKTLSWSIIVPFRLVEVPPPVVLAAAPVVEEPLM